MNNDAKVLSLLILGCVHPYQLIHEGNPSLCIHSPAPFRAANVIGELASQLLSSQVDYEAKKETIREIGQTIGLPKYCLEHD